jgi:hypothetical protein
MNEVKKISTLAELAAIATSDHDCPGIHDVEALAPSDMQLPSLPVFSEEQIAEAKAHESAMGKGLGGLCSLLLEARESQLRIAQAELIRKDAALAFVKDFFRKLESGTDEDDPLTIMRRKYHAPIHARIDAALEKAGLR